MTNFHASTSQSQELLYDPSVPTPSHAATVTSADGARKALIAMLDDARAR